MNVLAEGFRQTLRRTPHGAALHIGGASFTYREVAAVSAAIQKEIRKFPVTRRIGIVCNNDLFTYAGLLAAVCAGCSFVPLNPAYPAYRLQKMMRSSGVEVVVGEGLETEPGICRVIAGVGPSEEVLDYETGQEEVYLLFTSGSTGEPKGVPVTDNNLRGFFSHITAQYPLITADRVLQGFDLSFDVSVYSVFSTWHAGACLYVPPAGGFRAFSIIAALRDWAITVAGMVPSVLVLNEKYLDGMDLPQLRLTFFVGERLTQAFAEKWQKTAPGCRIINCYGPTEATIFASTYQYRREPECMGPDVPIGTVFPGLYPLILDEKGTEADEGELLLGGRQVVNGYLNGDNAAAFVSIGGRRYYRTGDLVRQDKNGNLNFLGRNDQQVKISGYRVELREIEAALCDCGFSQALAIAYESNGAKRIIAFVCGSAPRAMDQLSARLPAFMLPSEIVEVEEMPLNPNGKMDRQQLIVMYERNRDIV